MRNTVHSELVRLSVQIPTLTQPIVGNEFDTYFTPEFETDQLLTTEKLLALFPSYPVTSNSAESLQFIASSLQDLLLPMQVLSQKKNPVTDKLAGLLLQNILKFYCSLRYIIIFSVSFFF
jgi:hypothetical protein